MMDYRDHDLTKINEISNNDTKTTSYPISNLEEPTSQSYGSLSHYSRNIRERRNRRQLRKRNYAHALYSIRRLPVQVTNNPLMNQFFNGSTFF